MYTQRQLVFWDSSLQLFKYLESQTENENDSVVWASTRDSQSLFSALVQGRTASSD